MTTWKTRLEQEEQGRRNRFCPLFCSRCGSDISDVEITLNQIRRSLAEWEFICPICKYKQWIQGTKMRTELEIPNV